MDSFFYYRLKNGYGNIKIIYNWIFNREFAFLWSFNFQTSHGVLHKLERNQLKNEIPNLKK